MNTPGLSHRLEVAENQNHAYHALFEAVDWAIDSEYDATARLEWIRWLIQEYMHDRTVWDDDKCEAVKPHWLHCRRTAAPCECHQLEDLDDAIATVVESDETAERKIEWIQWLQREHYERRPLHETRENSTRRVRMPEWMRPVPFMGGRHLTQMLNASIEATKPGGVA